MLRNPTRLRISQTEGPTKRVMDGAILSCRSTTARRSHLSICTAFGEPAQGFALRLRLRLLPRRLTILARATGKSHRTLALTVNIGVVLSTKVDPFLVRPPPSVEGRCGRIIDRCDVMGAAVEQPLTTLLRRFFF